MYSASLHIKQRRAKLITISIEVIQPDSLIIMIIIIDVRNSTPLIIAFHIASFAVLVSGLDFLGSSDRLMWQAWVVAVRLKITVQIDELERWRNLTLRFVQVDDSRWV